MFILVKDLFCATIKKKWIGVDRKTDRQTERQPNRQKDSQTDRKTTDRVPKRGAPLLKRRTFVFDDNEPKQPYLG